MPAFKPISGNKLIKTFIPVEQKESLDALAFAEGKPLTDLIRQAIEEFLHSKPDYILQELTQPRGKTNDRT